MGGCLEGEVKDRDLFILLIGEGGPLFPCCCLSPFPCMGDDTDKLPLKDSSRSMREAEGQNVSYVLRVDVGMTGTSSTWSARKIDK